LAADTAVALTVASMVETRFAVAAGSTVGAADSTVVVADSMAAEAVMAADIVGNK